METLQMYKISEKKKKQKRNESRETVLVYWQLMVDKEQQMIK